MSIIIVLAITVAGSRIGVIATVSVLLAGQFAAGAAIDRWGLLGAERDRRRLVEDLRDRPARDRRRPDAEAVAPDVSRARARCDRREPRAQVWIALWIVYIVWGSTYLGIELAGETIPASSARASASRSSAADAAAFVVWRRGAAPADRPRRSWPSAALSACCCRARTRCCSSPSSTCRSA
jgi:hypothetical protein